MAARRQIRRDSADVAPIEALTALVHAWRRHWDEVAEIQRTMPRAERDRVEGLIVDIDAALAQTRHLFALEFGPQTVAALQARLDEALASLNRLLPATRAAAASRKSEPAQPQPIESSRLAKNVRAVVAAGDALEMFLQPIVSLHRPRSTPVGYEALARFRVSPYEAPNVWLDRAADAGLQRELELSCVRAALDHLPLLPPTAYLTINVSPETLVSAAFDRLIAAVPGERLVVEVTEHAVVREYDSLMSTIRQLRSMGLRFAVDDAGAGFASFRHVLELSPDIIKLDLHLTRGVHGDRSREALVRSLVSFADDVGATLIAEGIETREDLVTLRDANVPFGQGFLFAKPQPASSVAGARQSTRSTRRGDSTAQTA